MGKQCWNQAVLESGSWGHSVLQTPALVNLATIKTGGKYSQLKFLQNKIDLEKCGKDWLCSQGLVSSLTQTK